MSDNLPATRESNEMALLAAESMADMKIDLPKVTIGQGSPASPAKVGHFNSSEKWQLPRLNGVSFIASHPSRVLFHGQDSKNKNARCASDDGINPSARILEPISPIKHGGCGDCPAANWSSGDTDRDATDSEFKERLAEEIGYSQFDSKKPLCTEVENAVFFDSDGAPFMLQLTKHNLKEMKRLQMAVNMQSLKKKAPGFAITFDLWLMPMEGKGNRHLLQFSQSKDWGVVSLDAAKERSGLAGFFKKQGGQVIADKHAEQDRAHIAERPAASEEDQDPSFHGVPWPDDEEKLPF